MHSSCQWTEGAPAGWQQAVVAFRFAKVLEMFCACLCKLASSSIPTR